jgi:hypothetical protein
VIVVVTDGQPADATCASTDSAGAKCQECCALSPVPFVQACIASPMSETQRLADIETLARMTADWLGAIQMSM